MTPEIETPISAGRQSLTAIREFAQQKFDDAKDVFVGNHAAFESGVAWLKCEAGKRQDAFNQITPSLVEAELLFGAVNYCFWQGSARFKPAGGASKMRALVFQIHRESPSLYSAIDRAIEAIHARGFPLADAREKHLRELASDYGTIAEIARIACHEDDAPAVVQLLQRRFPGFSDDPLGKRALVLPHILNRCHGVFPRSIASLPVAVDYHLPNILRYLGVIRYSERLDSLIDAEKEIPRHGEFEHELRSVVLIACERLAKQSGLTESTVDDLLWSARKAVPTPFHLTVTTDY